MDLQLNRKRVLVSGSYRGTGAIIAERFEAEGAIVIRHAFESAQAAHLNDADVAIGDICTDAGAQLVLAHALADGAIDVLVNNYGTAGRGSWTESSAADWIAMYEHNVLSAQRLIQGITPGMRERGWGRMINLGTVGSTRPNVNSPHYYAAKGALATMTASLAQELGPAGITVNLVSPGLILTAEVEAAQVRRGQQKGWGNTWAEIEPQVARDIPIRRIARREEVADLVLFLASPLAGAISAQNIRVDGGGLPITG